MGDRQSSRTIQLFLGLGVAATVVACGSEPAKPPATTEAVPAAPQAPAASPSSAVPPGTTSPAASPSPTASPTNPEGGEGGEG